MVGVSPSCDYYTFVDFKFSKIIQMEFEDTLDSILSLNFIDEDLKPCEISSKETLLRARKNFDSINVLDLEYEFFAIDTK